MARPKSHIAWAVALMASLITLVVIYQHFSQVPEDVPVSKLTVDLPMSLGENLAISPDGRHIAFIEGGSEGRLWIRDFDQLEPRMIEGTEGASWPFWSPDSSFIAFADGEELRKVPVGGGPSSRICTLASNVFYGGTWSQDGEVIVFSTGAAPVLYEVNALGGTPSVLVTPELPEPGAQGPTGGIVTPRFLPAQAGPRILAFAFGTGVQTTMMVQDLNSGERELLGPGCLPYYSPTGHIVYQTSPYTYELWALPFSLETLRATGPAFLVAERGRIPTVAADGTLVYASVAGSGIAQQQMGQQQLVWLDRAGERIGEMGVAGEVLVNAALSPDNNRVAVAEFEESNLDIWVYDPVREVRTRLSAAPEYDIRPVWSPDGESVAYSSIRSGNNDIYLRRSDGAGEEEPVAATPQNEVVCDWSQNGKYLLYTVSGGSATGADLWYLERSANGDGWEPHLFLRAPSDQMTAKFSPDGHYVAYVSNESGRSEVYVRPFPEGERQWTVSSDAGEAPRWSRDGKALFYVEGSDTLMEVRVSTVGEFSSTSATRLFQRPGLIIDTYADPYDVAADGQRFLAVETAGREITGGSIRVIQNWFAEFRDRQ